MNRKNATLLKTGTIKLSMTVISLATLFLFWYFATKYQLQFYIRFNNIPTPASVFHQALTISDGKFFIHIVNSARRIIVGFLFAAALGITLGIIIGRYHYARLLMMPALEVLRPIPAIAWVPMSIMLWPSNESSIVFITFVGAFFPILLNTINGVHIMDSVLVRAGQCLGASEPKLLWYIILPGALPGIFTGLEVGMGVAWVSLIAAEMISGQYGVGYFTWESYSLVNYPAIVLGMATIGGLGFLCSVSIRLLGRACMPWRRYANGGRHAANA